MRIDMLFNFNDLKLNTTKRKVLTSNEIELEKIKNRVKRYDFANKVLERAKYLVPVETGSLRDSIILEVDTQDNIRIVVKKWYGIFVHERLNLYHKRPTQAKFLEDAAVDVNAENGFPYTIAITYSPELAVYIDNDEVFANVISWGRG